MALISHWVGVQFRVKAKKQPTISLSSAKAEYRALRKVAVEISWLKRRLGDLSLFVCYPILVFCDSQATIHIAKNVVFHERTKHIDVDCHFIHDRLSTSLISLQFLHYADQLAYIMTKYLSEPIHHHLLSKLAMYSPSSLRGVLTWTLGHLAQAN